MRKLISLLLVLVLVITIVPEFPEQFEIKRTVEAAKSGITSDGYGYNVSDAGEVSITYYNGSENELVIPESIDGYPVRRIGESAFEDNYRLRSVEIPGSITTISDSAFRGCESLTSVKISEGVTTIGDSAFESCNYLNNINIPESVISIGKSAFSKCYRLESISIPNGITTINASVFMNCLRLKSISISDSVISIGDEAFSGCSLLTDVYYSGVSEQWKVINTGTGNEYLLDSVIHFSDSKVYDGLEYEVISEQYVVIKRYIGDATDVIIPKTIDGYPVCEIGSMAFKECDTLTSISIPEGVIAIGDKAFYKCSGLISVELPNSITTVGDYAFYYCTALEDIVIPEGVTTISNYAFFYCSSLTDITIPKGVTSIGNFAFYYCSGITGIIIPEGVTSIGNGAFSHCEKITDIIIPEGVTTISDSMFSSCYSLESVAFSKGITAIGNSAFSNCDSLTSIPILEEVTTIEEFAFFWCDSLTNITISDKVKEIADYAFGYCDALTDVYFLGSKLQWDQINIGTLNTDLLRANIHYAYLSSVPEFEYDVYGFSDDDLGYISYVVITGYDGDIADLVIPEYIEEARVEVIDSSAFSNCKSLKSVVISDAVYDIGSYAFSGCTNLESVTLPENLAFLDRSAFANCTSLKNITFPESFEDISDSLFSNCTSLESIVLPEALRYIGKSAFSNCTSLKNITISKNLKRIYDSAFETCTSLTDVYYEGSIEEWNSINIGENNDCLLNANIHFLNSVAIDTVDIIDIDFPSTGGEFDKTAVCVTSGIANTDISVTWFEADGSEVTETIAEYGNIYTAQVILTPSNGYVFTSDITATVNGNASSSVTKNSDGTLTITYAFGATTEEGVSPIIHIEAESFVNQSGVTVASKKYAGATVVNSIAKGDTVTYDVEITKAGSYTIDINTSSQYVGAKTAKLYVDDVYAGQIVIESTGSWTTFNVFTSNETYLRAGNHKVTIEAYSGSSYLFDWIKFTRNASAGVSGADTDGSAHIEAEAFTSQSGITVAPKQYAGATVINSIAKGDSATYDIELSKSGNYIAGIRVASLYDGTKTVKVYVDGEYAGQIMVDSTGSWTVFNTFKSDEIYMEAGKHSVTFEAASGGSYLVDWVEFEALTE